MVSLEGSLLQSGLLPEIGSEVRVRALDGGVRRLGEVAKSGGLADSGGVAILDSGHMQKLLGDGSRHDASSAGSGDEAHGDGSALAGNLKGRK